MKLSVPDFDIVKQTRLPPGQKMGAPEGMCVVADRLFVVDQGSHMLAAFDAQSLELIGFCGSWGKSTAGRWRAGGSNARPTRPTRPTRPAHLPRVPAAVCLPRARACALRVRESLAAIQ